MANIAERPLVAVVGGDTLLGKEIRELLDQHKPVPRVELISTVADGAAVLVAAEDEPLVMTPLSAQSLEGSRVAFLAGTAASSRRTLKVTPPGGPGLIDLAGSLEEQPEARLRAPSAEPAGSGGKTGGVPSIQVIAHPAAIALAMF
ncbi:MAG: hypothetical protein ACRD5L_17890, partial [Bryobacteraceae bacterium]